MKTDYTDSLFEDFIKESYTSPYLNYANEQQAISDFKAGISGGYIDYDAFHKACDKVLAANNLLDIFNDEGKLRHRGVYGSIKNLEGVNDTVFKLAKKLWVETYVNNLISKDQFEQKTAAKKKAEDDLRIAKETLEKNYNEIISKLDQQIMHRIKIRAGEDSLNNIRITVATPTSLTVNIEESPRIKELGRYTAWDTNHTVNNVDMNDIDGIVDKINELLNTTVLNSAKNLYSLLQEQEELNKFKLRPEVAKYGFDNRKSYYYLYNNKYVKVYYGDNRLRYVDALAYKEIYDEKIPVDADFVAYEYKKYSSSGRCYVSSTTYWSWNSKLTSNAFIASRRLHNGSFGGGQTDYFDVKTKEQVQNDYKSDGFVLDFGFDSWGVHEYECDSSD